jgi:fucose 4-O-acetylase-like acetyltransferase
MITMPGFCFVSGYFSKKGDKCYQSAVFDFLMPYLIFNTLFVLFYGSSAPNIFTPTFAYWYLMCMFFWKLLTKALQQIKYIIPISFVVALLVGGLSDVGHFLSLSRTIGFLPFYLIGMKMSREDVAKLENLPKVAVFVVTMVVMAVWGWLNVKGVYHIDLYYYWEPYAGIANDPMSMSHMGFLQGMLFRALGYVVSGVLIVFLFCIIPDKSLPIMRDGGTRTMVPYLLHTYFIMNMKYLYKMVPALDRWYFTVPIALVMAVFLMWLLGLPALDELYKDLMGFVKKILYKDPQKA